MKGDHVGLRRPESPADTPVEATELAVAELRLRRAAAWQGVALIACLTVLVVAGVVVFFGPAMVDRWAGEHARQLAAARAGQDDRLLAGAPETLTYRAVVRKVIPSVVNISARFPGQSFLVRDPTWGRLYRRDVPGQAGQGSGFIVRLDEAGKPRHYVLTNHHVVTGQDPASRAGKPVPAETISVELPDRREPVPAEIVGLDPGADLALLSLPDVEGLAAAALGDSDAVEVGDRVLALGSPFGLQHSVTEGIISAKGRTGLTAADRVEFIQTSAAVNPGNSGGPLVDMAGRIIGINTAILSKSGGSQGISFAVPINTVKQSLARMLAEHSPGGNDPVRIRRGWLGVAIESLNRLTTPDDRNRLGLPETGAVVIELLAGGPAARAGLKAGDVIMSIEGEAVADAADLRRKIGATPVGKRVMLRIWRSGQAMEVQVTTGEMPTPEGAPDTGLVRDM